MLHKATLSKPVPGRPRKTDLPERDKRIVEAASTLFLSKGFSETSLEEIAKAAGTAKKTLYRQFGDKIALFSAVMAALSQQFLQFTVDAGNMEPTVRDALESVALRLAEASVKPESVALNAAIIETAARFPHVAAVYSETYERALAGIEALFAGAAAKGEIALTEFSAREAAECFVAVAHTSSRRAALLGRAVDQAEAVRRARRSVALLLKALHPGGTE